MLVLSRKKNEAIEIDGGIRVMVVEIRGDKVRLGITAPAEIGIVRPDAIVQVKKPLPIDGSTDSPETDSTDVQKGSL